MGNYDPYSNFAYGQTGIPPAFTQQLVNLGFVGAPFSSPQQTFDQQAQYMHVLKNVLDTQLAAFNNGNNTAAMPFNMRGLFNAASVPLTDPLNGIIGAPGMFSNGYAMGNLPNNGSLMGAGYYNAAHGYPGIPAPNYQFSNSGGTPSPGGQAALSQSSASTQQDSGTHQALDSNGNTYTINQSYGSATPTQQDDMNRYAHNVGNVGA